MRRSSARRRRLGERTRMRNSSTNVLFFSVKSVPSPGFFERHECAHCGDRMQEHCSVPECTEEGIASIDGRVLCRTHFLTSSYQRLEAISGQIHRQELQER